MVVAIMDESTGHNDVFILRQSNIDNTIHDHHDMLSPQEHYVLYGDSIYPYLPHLRS